MQITEYLITLHAISEHALPRLRIARRRGHDRRSLHMHAAMILALLAAPASGHICGGTPCITAVDCPPRLNNATLWSLMHQMIDGKQATNIVLSHPPKPRPSPGVPAQPTSLNCPGGANDCHTWSPGFGDRNQVFFLDGSLQASFTIKSWPTTKSLPVGSGQTPPDYCLSLDTQGGAPRAGSRLAMSPCSKESLRFRLNADGTIGIIPSVPVAASLCVAAPEPPPRPPPGRPNHYFSCTKGLAGGRRLPYPFCDTSLSLDERLDDLLSRATCDEKAAAITSTGSDIPRLGVPRLGSAEDTHGLGTGCIPRELMPSALSNSTGCPTTFPAGPGLGASFDRPLWRQIGETIGQEARGLNNMGVSPLYFLDPDINLLRDPRWGRAQEVQYTRNRAHMHVPM